MPFADGIGVITVLQQDLREETVLEGDIGVITGKTG
jgi:hypothetical protein